MYNPWVLYITVTLAALGMTAQAVYAVIQWATKGDFWYAVIWIIGMIMFVVAMIPMVKLHRILRRVNGRS